MKQTRLHTANTQDQSHKARTKNQVLTSLGAAGVASSLLLGVTSATPAMAASSSSGTAVHSTVQSATRQQIQQDTQAGGQWLLTNGGTANQDWAAIAGYAAGLPESVPQLSAAKMQAEIPSLKATTDYARFILALLAEGFNPHRFAGRNFVAELANAQIKTGADAGKFADNINGTGTDLINSQSWAIMALEDAGGASYNRTAAATWLIRQQNKDGGFGYSRTYNTSDADDTAAAIVALTLLGYHSNSAPIEHALAYLKTQQTPDGGFKNGATTSNSDSTGVVADALAAVGINPLSWTQPGGNPISALLGFHDPKSGGFNYDNTGQSWSGVSAYSTRDGVLGLSAYLSGHSVYQRLHFTTLNFLNPYWEHIRQQHGMWLWHHWYTWQQILPMAVAGSYSYELTPAWQRVLQARGQTVAGRFEAWDIHLATGALAARFGWDTLYMNGIS